jgi:hypothetical protein
VRHKLPLPTALPELSTDRVDRSGRVEILEISGFFRAFSARSGPVWWVGSGRVSKNLPADNSARYAALKVEHVSTSRAAARYVAYSAQCEHHRHITCSAAGASPLTTRS